MKDTQQTGPKVDFILGLDLGQVQDYTAAVILERKQFQPLPGIPPQDTSYAVRWLKRWTLGTKYNEIITELETLVQKPPLKNPLLAVDQTGVGRAVVDVLRAAELKAVLHPIQITAGHQIGGDGDAWNVPKKELVSTLQVLLQSAG